MLMCWVVGVYSGSSDVDVLGQAFSQKWQFFQKYSYQYFFYSYIQNDTVTHFRGV